MEGCIQGAMPTPSETLRDTQNAGAAIFKERESRGNEEGMSV